MKRSTFIIIGAVLAVLGVAGLLVNNVSYQDRDTMMDVGPMHAEVQTEQGINIPPLAAGAVALVGVVFMAVGATRKG